MTGTPQLAPVTRFGLELTESVGAGFDRIVAEQVELASWHAERIHRGAEHVHGVRKASKRLRAVLRMIRDTIGDESYRISNAIARDVAREVSSLRSATMRAATLESLMEWRLEHRATVDGIHAALASDIARLQAATSPSMGLGEDLAKRLRGIADNARSWPLPDSMNPTTSGLERTYARGRRAMTKADVRPSTHHFHEWRKGVKYLRHQIEILSADRTDAVSSYAVDLAGLGEDLGQDHDLADLDDVLGRDLYLSGSPALHDDVRKAIAIRRSQIQAELPRKGQELYGRSVSVFIAEMNAYWHDVYGDQAALATGADA